MQLRGVLDKIIYRNNDSSYTVALFIPNNEINSIKIVGILPELKKGENLELGGNWVVDKKFGKQFKIESFLPITPKTEEGILGYLSSGVIRGIGPILAEKIVKRFGKDTLAILEENPYKLREVGGIGKRKIKEIVDSLIRSKEIRNVMICLASYGIGANLAVKIYNTYGNESITIIKENPYQFASDIRGIGFKKADEIAAKVGIPKDSPYRAEAATLYFLDEFCDRGNTYYPIPALKEELFIKAEIKDELAERAIHILLKKNKIVRIKDKENNDICYIREIYNAEEFCAWKLKRILEWDARGQKINEDILIPFLEKVTKVKYSKRQKDAIIRSFSSRVLIITGGPGTGKTTLLNGILTAFKRYNYKVEVCAPTGRAAKKLEEVTGFPAKTIHRLLEYSPKKMQFTRDNNNPLNIDCLVVDEVSMVDINLFSSLLRALPDGVRIILVGDRDQLPSIGPGNVLSDLIESSVVDVIVLKEIFRQVEESTIIYMANMIKNGETPDFDNKRSKDFFFLIEENPEQILKTAIDIITRRVPQKFFFNPVSDIQVITPMNRGHLGTDNLNIELQKMLNPALNVSKMTLRGFWKGDKVMQIKNNYDKEVYNGDIGTIFDLDQESGTLVVSFDKRKIAYYGDEIDELSEAYAITVHKSQGSEYPCVVLLLHTQHYTMLQRNLIYTAITRGKKLVIVIGSLRAMKMAIMNDRVQRRYTGLKDFLN